MLILQDVEELVLIPYILIYRKIFLPLELPIHPRRPVSRISSHRCIH
jgi:hypothetical protein